MILYYIRQKQKVNKQFQKKQKYEKNEWVKRKTNKQNPNKNKLTRKSKPKPKKQPPQILWKRKGKEIGHKKIIIDKNRMRWGKRG